jgi:hypothetical protein
MIVFDVLTAEELIQKLKEREVNMGRRSGISQKFR